MSLPPPVRTFCRRLRRRLIWHRRKAAALCAAVAVFAGLGVVRPPPPPTTPVLVASRDLAAGTRIRPDDVVEARFPQQWLPSQSLTLPAAAVGRTLAVGLSRGSVVTRPSIAVDAWSRLPAGEAAVGVRLQDTVLAGLLRPGQHVRLSAVDPHRPTAAETLDEDAIVLAVPPPDRAGAGVNQGRLVVFEVTATHADLVTSSAVSRYLTVTWGP